MSTEAIAITTPHADYFAAEGLSNSGMKDLAVSPLRYWHLHINPDRPEPRETPEMTFGSALHCSVLEPEEFPKRYARQIDASDFADCLVTMDDLRSFLGSAGVKPKGTRKADLAAQVLDICPDAPILDVLQARHEEVNAGKVYLSKEDWARVQNAAAALLDEPAVVELLSEGQPEVSMFATDPETGVLLKSRMDWVSPACTLDMKTFSQQRGRSIDESITKAIWYERYHWQAYFYSMVRSLKEGLRSPTQAPPFVFAFVESDPPHEVRIRSLQARELGEPCLLWMDAWRWVSKYMRLYAECVERFGEKPWRDPRGVEQLADEEFPGLIY
jgi:hypothetical protein